MHASMVFEDVVYSSMKTAGCLATQHSGFKPFKSINHDAMDHKMLCCDLLIYRNMLLVVVVINDDNDSNKNNSNDNTINNINNDRRCNK